MDSSDFLRYWRRALVDYLFWEVRVVKQIITDEIYHKVFLTIVNIMRGFGRPGHVWKYVVFSLTSRLWCTSAICLL